MFIKCSTCGTRISMGWLFLGLPWSKYTCSHCGSIFAGTLMRLAAISVSTGILGYLLFGAIKGKINPLYIPLPLMLTLAVLFLELPMQIKKVGATSCADDSKDGSAGGPKDPEKRAD